MATIKSYTDINQSEKLAEILPIESADMYYEKGIGNNYRIDFGNYADISISKNLLHIDAIPCWSLAALLGVLPFHLIINNQRYAFSMHKGVDKDGETYMIRYNIFNTDICLYKTEYYNNPIDACVAMVEKLHELKLL